MNNELERVWKEAIVVQVAVLSRHMPSETEETTKVNIAALRAEV
jgi:hypothetical protein